jgi:hypothetical protein
LLRRAGGKRQSKSRATNGNEAFCQRRLNVDPPSFEIAEVKLTHPAVA